MQLQNALLEIAEIRERMATSQVFRGYRAQAAATSGILAIVAAWVQVWIVPNPAHDLETYVRLWSAVAAVSVAVTATDLSIRWLRDVSGSERLRVLSAARALVPCLVTGALATVVIVRFSPELGWTLPSIWGLLFAQGVFASAPLLPRAAWWIGAYYVAASLVGLAWGRQSQSPAGWMMAVTFGVGQLLAASVLYLSLERRDAA